MNNRGSYIKEIVAVLYLSIAAGMIGLQASPVQQASAGAKLEAGTAIAKAMPPADNADRSVSPGKPETIEPGGLNYLIGPGDMLAVNVWKDSELSRELPVLPDGKISLPLIGDIQAAGLMASELQERIQRRLEVFVSHPRVNVIVKEIRSRSFNIVGKVSKSGAYDLKKPTTVLDAIAQAGGFQDFARVTKIYILRHTANGETWTYPFNYKDALRGNAVNQSVELLPGDTVVVP